ncbi:MAG: ABC transporter permease [Pirellulales bacterium]|nr:ABC transporter permease [Pirellulales bacterium]
MSRLGLILASLRYHGRMNLAVALGAAVGVAVLSGALLVGDSMRASLRGLTLERLGRTSDVLVAGHFFRAALADELADRDGFKNTFSDAVPAILMRGTVERSSPEGPVRRAGQVNVIGCNARFWRLGEGPPPVLPEDREIVLNRPLARQLGVDVGDTVLLRFPRLVSVPAESPLGRKIDTTESARLHVVAVVPAEGLGRFGLSPSQQLPRNAFVSLKWLQQRLEQPGRVNAILVGTPRVDDVPPDSADLLDDLLHPTLDDLGLRLTRTPKGYFNLTTERMLFSPGVEAELLRVLDALGYEVQPVLVNLAITIAQGEKTVPYSTVAAIDFTADPPFGPLLDVHGKTINPLADDQIVLNAWAAKDLGAKPGDQIEVTYFDPEGARTPGQTEYSKTTFRLAAVTPLAGMADDPDLVPSVRDVTDRLTMAEWEPPFEFHAERIRPKDETYWDEHGATPKAFVSLATGRRLWASRFGQTTSLRIKPKKINGKATGQSELEILQRQLEQRLSPQQMGLAFQPVKAQGLAASAGTTPFGVLFLSFSFFLIAAAVMLLGMLFRLGVELRASQVGTLLALGFTRRRIQGMLVAEGLVVASVGGLIGTLLGVGYAALMLWGLRTWWVAAVGTPFLHLHVGATSLLIGLAAGLVIALVVILLGVRRLGRSSPRRLMEGDLTLSLWERVAAQPPGEGGMKKSEADRHATHPHPRLLSQRERGGWRTLIIPIVLLLAGGVVTWAAMAGGAYQAGAFFGAGALVLLGLLGLVRTALASTRHWSAVAPGRGNIMRLAARNAARRPGRSLLAVGLVAAACFLIVAISAFYQNPIGRTPRLNSGDGGFALVAQTDQPVYHDPGTPEGRAELGFTEADSQLLDDCTIVSFRVKSGDDASCLNLYQARRPRILGVPRSLLQRGGFAWAATEQPHNPWVALASRQCASEHGQDARATLMENDKYPIPVVLEKNTAMYAMHLYQGIGQRFTVPDDDGEPVELEVVGLLDGGLLQGCLLMNEDVLLQQFPEVAGYRFFLIAAPPEKVEAVRAALERTLGDYGLAAEPSGERLAGFLVVQNTYLSTFQSFGGLGLLLGTIGLAVVQWRNVIERRSELALLRATGFRRRTIGLLVLAENSLLLLSGLAVGVLAALVAVLPHLLTRSAAVPWISLVATLGIILIIGLLAALIAARAALHAPLLSSLRAES